MKIEKLFFLACILALVGLFVACEDPAKSIPQCTVSFNANGGSGTIPGPITVELGKNITLPNQGSLTRNSYTFGGWNTNEDSAGTNYQSGDSFIPTANTILYAKWNATYTVTFNTNSGSGTPPIAQTVSAGKSISLPDGSGLSKSGYNFGGWNINVSGTGTTYWSGDSYTPTGNITLYAKWNTTYTVIFNANGGSGTVPNPITVEAGKSTTIPNESGLTNTGYTFGGWNTNEDGTGIYYNAGSSYTPSGNITLYAKWDSNTYTVTYNINNGNGTTPAAQTVKPGDSITLPSDSGFSRSGYIFDGWSTNTSGTGTNYNADSSYTPSGNITLYAKWNRITHTITYNINNGTGTTPASQTVYSGDSVTLPLDSGFSKTGYTLGGWNTSEDGSGTNYSAGSSYTPSGNITLYAKWDRVTYTVTFNINSGTGTIPISQTINPGDSITLPSDSGFSRTGYTFGGWNTNTSGTGTNYNANSSYTPSGNITLYAKWNPLYTVSYNINGGTGTTPVSQEQATFGGSITLASGSGFSRTGYTFSGWNTNTSGTGTNYSADSSYTPSGSITLYAKWDRIIYTITYNINSGSGTTPAVQTVNSGDSVTLPTGNGLSRTGYTFNGWNTKGDGTGTNYSAGSSYPPTNSIILYAKWKEDVVVSGTTLADKLDWLAANAASNTGYILEVINAMGESLGPRILSYSGRSDIVITLTGIGATKIISLSSSGSLFSIDSGVTLVLNNNITLQGRSTNTASLISVNSGGSLIMNTGASISGNTISNSSYGGGGVCVYDGGIFTMSGGTISGNTATSNSSTSSVFASGGGVYVTYGTFTMSGGEITGNKVSSYGGGVSMSGGTFTMSGGEITGNTSSAYGGGVSMSGGTFSMSGGEITGNTSSSYGGGVSMSGGTFTMRGGEITGNTVSSSSAYGGGVYVSGGTFTKTNGGTITGYASSSINGNVAKINNTVRSDRGHAVHASRGNVTKLKEITAGPSVNLSFNGISTNGTFSGEWDN